MIEPGKSSKNLIGKIDALSGNTLTYKRELALFIDLAEQHQRIPALEQLSFLGKFVHKALGILKRTDKEVEDNRRLAKEFEESLEKIKNLMKDIVAHASPDVQFHFNREFLAMTPDAFEHLLVFCKDLSWYKNYLIDKRRV